MTMTHLPAPTSPSNARNWHWALVTKVIRQTPTVKTIFFTVAGGVLPSVAGQYISVHMPAVHKHEPDPALATTGPGKAYSLSSTPWDSQMSITVKAIGPYSRWLCELQVGDYFEVSSPFGFFNVRDSAPLVALVGGVGISPVWSIVRDELHAQPDRQARLLCSASSPNEVVFSKALRDLQRTAPHLQVDVFVTRSSTPSARWPAAQHRRLTVADDISDAEAQAALFYLCGSQSFVSSLWRQLAERGVDERRVVSEIFFEAAI